MTSLATAICARTRTTLTIMTMLLMDLAFGADASKSLVAQPNPVPIELKLPASPQPWQRYKVDSQGSSWPQADWSAYSTLNKISTAPPDSSLHYVTPIEGDASRGRQIAFDRARGGSCVSCHVFGKDTPAQPGNVGPDLSAIGASRSDELLFN